MRPRKLSVATIIGIPIFIGILFLLVGHFAYWRSHPAALSWSACLYGDKDCSLAASTWALTFVTLAAFVAAVAAAIYAAHTYALETNKALGHRLCADEEHVKSPDVTLYISSVRGKPLGHAPIKFKPEEFQTQHHAFLNLGRTPLTDVAVNYRINIPRQETPILGRLELDCVQVDGEIHLTIFIRKSLGNVRITWDKPAFEGKHQSLDFYPGKAYTTAAMKQLPAP